MTPPRAKPVRAWAVFTPPTRRHPAGIPILRSTRFTRANAIMAVCVHASYWPKCRAEGYRIARVVVTEERK